jgi:hypothetical protein
MVLLELEDAMANDKHPQPFASVNKARAASR